MTEFADGPRESGRPAPVEVETFLALEIRAGTVVSAEPFPEARKPALRMKVDFGAPVGILASSAQLTRRYTPEALVGTRVLGVVNLPPRRIAGFRSECLVLGVVNPEDPGDVLLVRPDEAPGLAPGWRLG
jgi:tRNA-binding protein